MYSIKSKYKNPDRYIEVLKGKVMWAELSASAMAESAKREKGEIIMTCSSLWKSDHATENSELFAEVPLNHKIAMIGYVESTTRYFNKKGKKCSGITIDVVEFRKFDKSQMRFERPKIKVK